MQLNSEPVTVYNGFGCPIMTYNTGLSSQTTISFEAVASPTYKNLCTIELEGN